MSRDDEVGDVESSDDGTSDEERKKSEIDPFSGLNTDSEEYQRILLLWKAWSTELKACSTDLKVSNETELKISKHCKLKNCTLNYC